MDNLDWKDKLSAAFNINPEDITSTGVEVDEPQVVDKVAMRLNVMLDKRNRNGKKVTLITDFTGTDEALKDLAKELKRQCGVGGSARGGEILIQGDFREKVLTILKGLGYKARII